MDGSIRLAHRARDHLQEAFAVTHQTWRDATATYYEGRFHAPAVAVLEAYAHAAERLLEAIEEAESAG